MNPLLAAVLAGMAIGIVVGALGAGGGILSIPILVYVLGLSPHSAAASSLVIVGATAVAGSVHHLRHRTIDWRNGAAFGLLGLAGSVLGARISVRIDGALLLGLLAGLLVVVSVTMVVKAFVDRRAERADTSGQRTSPTRPVVRAHGLVGWLKIIALATLTGFLAGFFGVGGAFIVVPVLVLVLGLSIRMAAGTSLLVMVIAAISGLLARVGTGIEINWPVTLIFAAASMTGGLIGGPLTQRARSWVLTLVFGLLLAVVAVGVGVQLGLGHA